VNQNFVENQRYKGGFRERNGHCMKIERKVERKKGVEKLKRRRERGKVKLN
jgi:hypothetical protein